MVKQRQWGQRQWGQVLHEHIATRVTQQIPVSRVLARASPRVCQSATRLLQKHIRALAEKSVVGESDIRHEMAFKRPLVV